MITRRAITHCLLAWTALGACGDSGGSPAKATEQAQTQTPPTDADALEAWLASGAYRDWQCEQAPHVPRSPSPHGANRICSNALISDHASESEDWPKGAAAVKEIYAAVGDATPMGYAVYVKTDADSGAGANWYWYERGSDGPGIVGFNRPECVACHSAAGSDAAHTPSAGGRDFVYTPVP